MTGYVYAMEDGLGHVKIGWTTSLHSRLAAVNTNSPSRCRIVGYVEGTQDQEKALHGVLHASRSHGEWFWKDKNVSLFLSLLPKREIAIRQAPFRTDVRRTFTGDDPKTIPDLIDVFGGNTAFAGLMGFKYPSTASEMKRRQSIPVCHWPRVMEIAAEHGLDLSERDLVQMHIESAAAKRPEENN